MSEEYGENNNVTKKYMENIEEEFKDLIPAIDPLYIPQEMNEGEWKIEISNVYEFIGVNQTTKPIADVYFEPFIVEKTLQNGNEINQATHYKPAIRLEDGSIVPLTNLRVVGSDNFFFHTNNELYSTQKATEDYGKGIITVHIEGEYLGLIYKDKVEINSLHVDSEEMLYVDKGTGFNVLYSSEGVLLAKLTSNKFNDGLMFVQKIATEISPVAVAQSANELLVQKGSRPGYLIEYFGPEAGLAAFFPIIGIIYIDGEWKKFKHIIEWYW